MTPKRSRGREFAETMTHHVFGDVDRDELFAVVDSKGVTDKFRYHHRSSTPRLDHSLPARLIHCLNPTLELEVDKGSFFE